MVFEFLQLSPAAFVAAVFVLGLLVGSFLNVVILRLPVMLEHEWRQQCQELMEGSAEPSTERPPSLVWPPSSCPGCGHRIRAWENIPVLSWLWLRGRCSSCRNRISVRYPLVELLTAVLSAVVAWRFGFGAEAAAALVLTWALVALSVIDLDHMILPDVITLPGMWLGLLLSLWTVMPGVDAHTAIIGAAAGYLSLWSVYHVFRLLTGKEGMGYGDFKLLAMLGAWLGWLGLPLIILLSSLVGAAVGLSLILLRGRDRNIPIPFGPYLAAAGWLTLVWREELVGLYLRASGMG